MVVIAIGQAASPPSPLLTEDLRTEMLAVSRRANTFQDVLIRMGAVDRVELSTVTDETASTLQQVRRRLESMDAIPADLAGVVALLDLALESWETGTGSLTEHLLGVADGTPSPGQSDRILDDLLELRAGDRLYRKAVEALSRADVTQPVSSMPDVAFLPSGYPVAPASQTLVAQAQADASPLKLRASLAIEQVTTVPEWVLDTEETLVVDATEQLVVRVIVTNAGNVRSDGSGIAIELAGGDGSAQSATLEVPALAPGETTTITFEPVPVSPGRSYSLAVRMALAPGEGETEDNSRTLRFRVNEGTPTTTAPPA